MMQRRWQTHQRLKERWLILSQSPPLSHLYLDLPLETSPSQIPHNRFLEPSIAQSQHESMTTFGQMTITRHP
jgi:hypothetical protein